MALRSFIDNDFERQIIPNYIQICIKILFGDGQRRIGTQKSDRAITKCIESKLLVDSLVLNPLTIEQAILWRVGEGAKEVHVCLPIFSHICFALVHSSFT